jgi:hypothetical protein
MVNATIPPMTNSFAVETPDLVTIVSVTPVIIVAAQ